MSEANGSGRIYWISGSKGGVGKSMMTLATVDHLLEQRENVLFVESDTSNPDLWKAYKEEVETELIDVEEADGWIHLVNTCDHRCDGVVVINTAARNSLAVKQYGRTLDSSLRESSGGGLGRRGRSLRESCRERRGDVRERRRSTRLGLRSGAAPTGCAIDWQRDNDESLSGVMALESIDSFFRRSPAELARLHRALHRERTRGIRGSSRAEAAQVQRTLWEIVAETKVAAWRRDRCGLLGRFTG
jgi:hypothetical protein